MSRRDLRALVQLIGLTVASIAFALGAGALANAEQVHWPWQQNRSYRQIPPSHRSYVPSPATRTTTPSPTDMTPEVREKSSTPMVRETTTPDREPAPAASAMGPAANSAIAGPRKIGPTVPNTPSRPMSPAVPTQATTPMSQPHSPPPAAQLTPTPMAQSIASAPPRRPQTTDINAASPQATAACANERKSASAEAAIKSCDSVIGDTKKNLANAYYLRANAKLSNHDIDGAIADYGLALKLDPIDSNYLNSRAQAYEAKNDLEKALTDYNAAIKADPQSIDAYNSRGAAFQRKGDYARAAADYGEVTRLQPDNADAWSARCWVRALSPGQIQMALSDCNAALQIKADSPDVLDTRGFIYLKLGQTDNSIRDYDAALKLDPKLAGSLYGRGIARIRRGDRAGGGQDMARARSIRADIAEEFARYGIRP